MEVLTDEVDILNVALATISATLEKTTCEREQVRESWVRFLIKTDDRGTASSVVQKAAKAAVNVLAMSGLGIRTDKS